MVQGPRDSWCTTAQWKFHYSPKPRKARPRNSTNKLMINPFSDVSNIIYIHWVLGGFTVNPRPDRGGAAPLRFFADSEKTAARGAAGF